MPVLSSKYQIVKPVFSCEKNIHTLCTREHTNLAYLVFSLLTIQTRKLDADMQIPFEFTQNDTFKA